MNQVDEKNFPTLNVLSSRKYPSKQKCPKKSGYFCLENESGKKNLDFFCEVKIDKKNTEKQNPEKYPK